MRQIITCKINLLLQTNNNLKRAHVIKCARFKLLTLTVACLSVLVLNISLRFTSEME